MHPKQLFFVNGTPNFKKGYTAGRENSNEQRLFQYFIQIQNYFAQIDFYKSVWLVGFIEYKNKKKVQIKGHKNKE